MRSRMGGLKGGKQGGALGLAALELCSNRVGLPDYTPILSESNCYHIGRPADS
jgi:hypothetical protein